MKLTSNWNNGTLFWRVFDKADTVYVVGWREGYLGNGQSVEINNPAGFFQMEIKAGGIFGALLLAPGRVYANQDEFVFTADGILASVEDAAEVVVDAEFKYEPYGSISQFFDWTRESADSSIEINSSITQVTAGNGETTTKLNNVATNEVTGQVDGDVSADGAVSAIKIGVKVAGAVSSKVTSKVEKEVTTRLNVQISTSQTYSEKQAIALKAGKFIAVVTSWQRRYITGTVSLGAVSYAFDATIAYSTSRSAAEYASPAAMPSALIAEYLKQFPNNPYLGALQLYWSPSRTDNFTTATESGVQDALAANYRFVRVEGYVFRSQLPSTVPLKLYWNANRADNFTTATQFGEQSAVVANYGLIRTEGYASATPQPGMVPLKLYWNASSADNFVTATEKGEQDARAAGYQFVRNEGYVIPA